MELALEKTEHDDERTERETADEQWETADEKTQAEHRSLVIETAEQRARDDRGDRNQERETEDPSQKSVQREPQFEDRVVSGSPPQTETAAPQAVEWLGCPRGTDDDLEWLAEGERDSLQRQRDRKKRKGRCRVP